MADWPTTQGQIYDTVGEVTSGATNGTSVSGTVNNTKGVWAELIASTARVATGMQIDIHVGGNGEFLIDIGIGAAGSEQVIIPNLHASRPTGGSRNGRNYVFPCGLIPAGTRISARCQASDTPNSSQVLVHLLSGGFPLSGLIGAVIDDIGTNTADSGGTQVDPGATANTKGAYSQLVATSTRRYRGLMVFTGSQGNLAMADARWLVDIAIGAASSEKIIIPDILFVSGSLTDIITPGAAGPFLVDIPSGTRLAARAQSDTNDATDRLLDVMLYGVT